MRVAVPNLSRNSPPAYRMPGPKGRGEGFSIASCQGRSASVGVAKKRDHFAMSPVVVSMPPSPTMLARRRMAKNPWPLRT